MESKTILIADHDTEHRRTIFDSISHNGFEIISVKNGEEALSIITNRNPDLVLAELNLPKIDTINLLSQIKPQNPDIHFIVFTANPTVDTAINSLKAGASEYLAKPINKEELNSLFNKIFSEKPKNSCSITEKKITEDTSSFNMIGKSNEISRIYKLIEKISDTDSTVIIYGESGTGKELVARAIHYSSNRSSGPFIPVNCGAIPEELLESELFGHEKGSFTGAQKTKTGRFELADGGTVFLDEIGDMSPNLQVKLLRVIQEREFERIGGVKSIKVDIRVIAATHRDLERAVKESKFREDLYYRLNVIPVELPPLRDRKNDIPLIVSHFIKKFNHDKARNVSGVSDEVMDCFSCYSWPGNVRELQNMIERLVVLKGGGIIEKEDLPEKLLIATDILKNKNNSADEGKPTETSLTEGTSFNTMVTDFEKQLIQQALCKANGVKNRAAKILDLNRTTLIEKMKKLQINNK